MRACISNGDHRTMKILTVIILCSLIISSCTVQREINTIKSPDNKGNKAEYILNNREVSEQEFSKFLSTLKEVTGTWFCAETINGGITGYDAKNKYGAIYEYRVVSENKKSQFTIRIKNIPE